MVDNLSQVGARFFGETKFVNAGDQLGTVQDTDNYIFPLRGGKDGHPQIKQAVGEVKLRSAVLRQAAFRDIQVSHNFETRDDAALQSFRQHLPYMHYAVDAVADENSIFFRFNVNVRGSVFNRHENDVMHQLDKRRFLDCGTASSHFNGFESFADHVFNHIFLFGIPEVDGLQYFVFGRNERFDAFPGNAAQFVNRYDIEGIDDRDSKFIA